MTCDGTSSGSRWMNELYSSTSYNEDIQMRFTCFREQLAQRFEHNTAHHGTARCSCHYHSIQSATFHSDSGFLEMPVARQLDPKHLRRASACAFAIVIVLAMLIYFDVIPAPLPSSASIDTSTWSHAFVHLFQSMCLTGLMDLFRRLTLLVYIKYATTDPSTVLLPFCFLPYELVGVTARLLLFLAIANAYFPDWLGVQVDYALIPCCIMLSRTAESRSRER